jgi:hypothetical protein
VFRSGGIDYLRRIVSGGQTGADRGGLDAAIALGLEHGGWCPRGRRAEDGVIPERYRLTETGSREYAVRTERNLVDSDATVLFTRGPATGGSALTAALAAEHDRPLLHLDLERLEPGAAVAALRDWLHRHRPAVLNVAGSRASRNPTLAGEVERILVAAVSGKFP